nr:unnamed protein product [Callosobruchus analis]
MFASEKIFLNRASREILRELRRSISKTSSASNSEAISSRQEGRGTDLNADRHTKSKWIKISRQNNIRALSTIQTKTKPPLATTPFFSKEESREFMAVFPDIVRDLTDAGRHTDIPEVTKRFAKVLQYNVPNGKKVRGLSTVISYKILEKPENLTPENIRLANVLGWCVEMLQSYFLIIDDVMDKSELRRGQPCWYRQEGVGLAAVNDALLVESSIYTILRKYFNEKECYRYITELFHEITTKTIMGQSLDMICMNPDGTPRLDLFTMNRASAIVKYKTAYYSFQLPVALAMYLANMYDPEQHRQAKTILLEMGEFFQVQDDYLDCYGDPEVTGKRSADIREGKCSWLAVVALQRATPAQRKIMEEHYGKDDEKSVQMVKDLYLALNLPHIYATYEEESYNRIRTHIQQISKGLPHELFFKLLKKLYKRDA